MPECLPLRTNSWTLLSTMQGRTVHNPLKPPVFEGCSGCAGSAPGQERCLRFAGSPGLVAAQLTHSPS